MKIKVKYLTLIVIILFLTGCASKHIESGKGNVIQSTVKKEEANLQIDKSKTEPIAKFLNNLTMINEISGWVLNGNKVLRTDDGGKIWSDVSPNLINDNKTYADGAHISACFYDSKTAWVSYGVALQAKQLILYHTTDGGREWDKILLPLKEDWESTDNQYISFVDPLNGFVLVNSEPALGFMNKVIYKTTDGGKSWLRMGDITGEIEGYPTGIKFISQKVGWITSTNHGQNYILTFKTNDGGISWHKEDLDMSSKYKDYYTDSYPPVFFSKEKKIGVLPIEYVNNESRFIIPYLTYDGGGTWKAAKALNNYTFSCYDFVNDKHWFAIDNREDKLYVTNTSGDSWTVISQNEMFKEIKVLDFVSTKIGLAIGDNVFIETIDGGKTWNSVNFK